MEDGVTDGASRADVPYQAAQMGAHLDAARRLAGPQHDRRGPALLRVIDLVRQEAAFVIMGVEQRELLIAVDDSQMSSKSSVMDAGSYG